MMSSRNGMMGLLETPPAGSPAYRPPVSHKPNYEFMHAPNKPHSQLLFKIQDQEINICFNARWSKDGKRPMFEMLQFWSTYLQRDKKIVKAKKGVVEEFKRHYEVTSREGQDFIDIKEILKIIEKDAIPDKKNDDMAKAHRDAIETTLKAFLNGNSSMITSLEPWTQAASAVQDELTDKVPPRGGVKASSSAPMQQSCSPVQAQDASPVQVLAVCVHGVLLRHLRSP